MYVTVARRCSNIWVLIKWWGVEGRGGEEGRGEGRAGHTCSLTIWATLAVASGPISERFLTRDCSGGALEWGAEGCAVSVSCCACVCVCVRVYVCVCVGGVLFSA